MSNTADLPIHNGTHLPAGEAAIVTIGGCQDIEFLMPKVADKEVVPQLVMLLMACYLRLQNEQSFIDEMMDWLDAEHIKTHGGVQ